MTDAPAFSVLMPVYNAADFVEAAAASVLTQSLGDLELLVMDDGSTDETPAALARIDDPRVRRFRQDNRGKSAALNELIAVARGRWIALQDADDLGDPDRLRRLAARLSAGDAPVAVMSGHDLLIGDRRVAPRGIDKSPSDCDRDIAAYRMPAHDPTLACRTDVARTLPFEPSLTVGQGLDFVLRLGERHPMAVVGDSLYHYRVNEGSATRSRLERRAAGVRKVLDRARARRGVAPFSDEAFAAFYGPVAADPTNNLIGHFIDSAYLQTAAGRRGGALRTALEALRCAPLTPRSLKPLIYALSPRPLARLLRRG